MATTPSAAMAAMATTPSAATPTAPAASASADELRAALAQRDTTIAKLKVRAKQFVAQMRGQLAAEKVKAQQMEALARERQRACDAQAGELSRLRAAALAVTASDKQVAAETAETAAKAAAETAAKAAAETAAKAAAATAMQQAATIQQQAAAIANLTEDLARLRAAQNQSTELMAAANTTSRDKQAALDEAVAARREMQAALEAAEEELEEARGSADEARQEMQHTANQAALQHGASQQVLKDTRSMVTSLEKERDILSSKLNDIRVQAKDGSLKLEEDLRVARKGLLAMREEMQSQKAGFVQKRELAKRKFHELVARAEESESAARTTEAAAARAAATSAEKERGMADRIAHLEGTLNVVTQERDAALEAQDERTDGADADRERLITSLASTRAELKEQRQKRLVAKNEILTMVRQLDGNRDTMSTLFSQLQQLVTKTGTFVIECRSMETKCDEALIALDVDVDMDVDVEFTRRRGGVGSGGGGGGDDSGSEGSEGSAQSDDDGGGSSSGVRWGRENSFSGVSVELSGLSMANGKGGNGARGRGRGQLHNLSSGSSKRRSPRSPIDAAVILDDEFSVLASVLDEVQRKVEALTKHVSDELSVSPQGVQRRLPTVRDRPVNDGGDGCVGYLKRVLVGGGSGGGGGGVGRARSPRAKRMVVGSSEPRSEGGGGRGTKKKKRPKRGGYGELDSEGYV
jgi:hypothetical protein